MLFRARITHQVRHSNRADALRAARLLPSPAVHLRLEGLRDEDQPVQRAGGLLAALLQLLRLVVLRRHRDLRQVARVARQVFVRRLLLELTTK